MKANISPLVSVSAEGVATEIEQIRGLLMDAENFPDGALKAKMEKVKEARQRLGKATLPLYAMVALNKWH